MTPADPSAGLAPHACAACKKQKRRCDKRLPECSLCSRMSRACDYTETPAAAGDSLRALQNRVTELEMLLLQRNQQIAQQSSQLCQARPPNYPTARMVNTNPFESFPAMFFLDNEIFQECQMNVPKQCPPIAKEIYDIIGDVDGLKKIGDRYFDTIHVWFPILSKKRLELLLSEPNKEVTPDLALLFAAMHLLSDEESHCQASTGTNDYWAVKNYAVALEANAVMTPQLLQSNLLIALYEIGHAIYPAAYLSIGNCATFAKALGLDNRNAPQMLRRFGAWTEMEELKRLWWAVLLLDRYVHLGIRGHALSTGDPSRNDVLPTEDVRFSQTQMAGSEPLYVASPTSVKTGPFTRACQAANLIGKVVAVLNEWKMESETRFSTALQIHRILTPFVKIVQDEFTEEPEAFATAMALAYSALITLSDPFCCNSHTSAHTVEEAELQAMCINSIVTVSEDIARFAFQLKPSMSLRPAAISPLIGNCLYMGTITFAWRVYEGERSEALESYNVLRESLSSLNWRWAVGGQYLDTVDKAKEIMYNSSLL